MSALQVCQEHGVLEGKVVLVANALTLATLGAGCGLAAYRLYVRQRDGQQSDDRGRWPQRFEDALDAGRDGSLKLVQDIAPFAVASCAIYLLGQAASVAVSAAGRGCAHLYACSAVRVKA